MIPEAASKLPYQFIVGYVLHAVDLLRVVRVAGLELGNAVQHADSAARVARAGVEICGTMWSLAGRAVTARRGGGDADSPAAVFRGGERVGKHGDCRVRSAPAGRAQADGHSRAGGGLARGGRSRHLASCSGG